MIIGSYRDLVLPVAEMPVIFQQPDVRPVVRPGKDFFVRERDGLNDFAEMYESNTGNLLIGVICRQAAFSADVDASAYWNNEQMQLVHFRSVDSNATAGGGVALALFGIRNGSIGQHEFRVQLAGAEFGFGGVQVDDILSLGQDLNVSTGGYGNDRDFKASGVVVSTHETPTTSGNLLLCMGGVLNYQSYPVTCRQYGGDKAEFHSDYFGHEIEDDLQISYSFNRYHTVAGVMNDGLLGFSGVSSSKYAGLIAEINGVFE